MRGTGVSVIMVMVVAVIVVVAVVCAGVRRRAELSVQVGGDLIFHGAVGESCAHGDAMLGEVVERTPAHAAGDDHLDGLLAQPAWERAGLMFGGGQGFDLQGEAFLGVEVDEGELAATTEVVVQASILNWDGEDHGWFGMRRFRRWLSGEPGEAGLERGWSQVLWLTNLARARALRRPACSSSARRRCKRPWERSSHARTVSGRSTATGSR